jgi:prophage maintenance system killer protein
MQKDKQNKGEIIIYQTSKKEIGLKVRLEKDTVWLTQSQIAELFNSDRSVITKHIKNILNSGELVGESNVQKMHIANSDKPVKFYNLDMIISVGYRVNSKYATHFRIWATNTLKQHILQGYTINENMLLEVQDKFRRLQTAVSFLQNKTQKKQLKGQEKEILNLLADYSKTLTILEQYDKEKLKIPKGKKATFVLKYEKYHDVILELRKELISKKEASDIFGNDVTNKFNSIIKNLYQTYGGKELYKGLENKAAHLLYLTIKDHPFTDGNKRIGSFSFVYFLDKNNYLYRKNGEKKINDNALTALALLIAESDPKEKDILIKIVMNLLHD